MSEYERGEWAMFDLISSVFLGKQVYFLNDDGSAFSRLSRQNMTVDEAYNEFLRMIGADE